MSFSARHLAFFTFIWASSSQLQVLPAQEPAPAPVFTAPSAQAAFAQGNEAYANSDFSAAESFYKLCINDFAQHSAPLHYNLANTLRQQNRLGEAVLHYRRALFLDPNMAEATLGLRHTLNQLEIPIAEPGFLQTLAQSLSPNLWTMAATFSFWSMITWFTFLLFFRRSPLLIRLAALISLPILPVSALALYAHNEQSTVGIVLHADAPLHVAPSATSKVSAYLPEATEVRLTQQHDGFRYVEAANEKRGWMPASSVQTIHIPQP